MSTSRSWFIDATLLLATAIIAVVVIASVVVPVSRLVSILSIVGLVAVALTMVVARIVTRPDHLKAVHARRVLEIADRSLSHLRRGLDYETAQAVCGIVLAESEAAAVAITDTTRVLGFAGTGQDHHEVGGPILTRATREAIETNEHRVLASRDEIGCPRGDCLLRAAIVVPLESRGEAVGTLKFYYTTPRLLNETQVSMVQGLARLLSTQLELAELERQTELACHMELKALQAQIHPHFLFNTINTIAMLIRTDPTTARELLREFAAFYRRMLEDNEGLIPLRVELEHALTYLRFEKARFGDRLEVRTDLDEEITDTQVPAFILQPLVENCVQHGMRPDQALTITITGHRSDGAVRVFISDDGAGIPPTDLPRVLEAGYGKGLGIALKNVDDRLRGYFGSGSGLTVESREGEGTTVTLSVVTEMAGEGGGTDAQSAPR